MFKRQKQILLRTTALIILLIGFTIYITFDAFYSYDYAASKVEDPLFWLTFWTHWSNIGALLWIIPAWFAVVFKIESLEKRVNGQFIKNLVFTFIIVTGLVFLSVSYVPTIIKFSDSDLTIGDLTDGGSIELVPIWYRATVIIGTTFKHLFTPGIFVLLAIYDGDYTKSKFVIRKRDKAFILFIVPVLYFLFVIILTSYGVRAPYPVLDYVTQADWWVYIVYIIFDLLVATLFIFTSITLSKIEEKRLAKNESTTEIVQELLLKEK